MLEDGSAPFNVVILSAQASNLVPCVASVFKNEPNLAPHQIVVVDDGAWPQAEAQLPHVNWVQGIKPFNFARNANLGIRAAGTDVFLLNDDTKLATPRGFTLMWQQMAGQPGVGLCSPGIRGVVVNPNQVARGDGEFRPESHMLAFVCVYIPKRTYDQLGPLDERFTGYGFEDNDYCVRAQAAGLQLGVWDGCVVDHSGELPSTFGARPDKWDLYGHNRWLFREKWGRDA